MKRALGGELERLIKRINPNVLPEEIELAKQGAGIDMAINSARLRLDSVRLIVRGEVDQWKA